MLLSQFKTGAARPAVGLRGLGPRNGVGASSVGRPALVSVRAMGAAGAAAASDGDAGPVQLLAFSFARSARGLISTVLGQSTKQAVGPDMVVYKGTITVMKKLLALDLMDRKADLEDDFSELRGKKVSVQLVSNEVDDSTGKSLVSRPQNIDNWVTTLDTIGSQNYSYKMEFAVTKDFGVPGAILVKNDHPNEFLLVSFTLTLPDKSEVHFITNSWVYNTADSGARIFFHNKAYLPQDTPSALRDFREAELRTLQGDGTGTRQVKDRIYDYDVYNDLGDVDGDAALERPILGTAEHPYPRRCRTGRPRATRNSAYEKANSQAALNPPAYYVPRDECFERTKNSDFLADTIRSKGHQFLPQKYAKLKPDFESVAEIRTLYAPKGDDLGGLNNILQDDVNVSKEEQNPYVFLQELVRPDGQWNTPTKYPLPAVLQADDNAWRTSEQFAREFLAGLNPAVISLVKQFPLKSDLDSKVYGDATSAITAQHIEANLEGLTVDQAVSDKKLFVADFHDAYMPFVNDINTLPNRKTYATRALFFLRGDETLKVLALELALPPSTSGGEKKSRVFVPPKDSSKLDYIWLTARAHVANNNIVAHQVFSHWTRCHAVTEPVIISTNRHLSKLHPIYHLLSPHLGSTMYINQGARGRLIAAGGTIESTFTPGKYAFSMASANYKDTWTFNSQMLPNDLIARGMAEPDPSSKHGIKLVIQDYPYAVDGLELWDAIKTWNQEYVDIFYKDDNAVGNDTELREWWDEIRVKGHPEKSNAGGWPELNSKENLAIIATTIQWITSCQHAAVNFGQYSYAGFMPHHPTLTRRLFPDEGTPEWEQVKQNPEKFYLSTLSDRTSATRTMSVYEILSSHAPGEVYLGESHFAIENDQVESAFKRFSDKLSQIDAAITKRNADPKLKNRLGAARFAYELLRPKSKQGVTAKGIPNSITI